MPEIRRVTFKAPFAEPHLSIDCWPPFADLNAIFMAASKAFLDPYRLAIDCGKLSDERADDLLMQAFAEGVVASSPTPGYEGWSGREWLKFFRENPDHFDELRRHLTVRRNWDDPKEPRHGVGVQQP